MIVIVKYFKNGTYVKEIKRFKRKGISYFIFRLMNIKYDVSVIENE